MKKVIIYWFCLLAVLFWMTSCGSKKPKKPIALKDFEKTEITTTVHDTVFKTVADSSFYQAYLECVNGQPVLKNPNVKPSKNGALQPPKVKLKGNELTVDCEALAQELFAKWKSTYEVKTIVKEIPIEVMQDLSFLQELQIWIGRIALLILVGLLIIRIVFFKIK